MISKLLSRLFTALPDLLTTLFFLAIWIAPLEVSPQSVSNGMLIMLVEFILVHASGFLGAQVFNAKASTPQKIGYILGFSVFYSLFIAVWAWSFQQWWPIFAFSWLIVGKLAAVILAGRSSEQRRLHMQSDWAIGAMAYVGGVFLTLFLPVPRFGISREVVTSLNLSGSGVWVDEPQRVIAFGVFYFAILAWVKWRNYTLPAAHLPQSAIKS